MKNIKAKLLVEVGADFVGEDENNAQEILRYLVEKDLESEDFYTLLNVTICKD